jgi:exopolysaccharide production protein ExoZ
MAIMLQQKKVQIAGLDLIRCAAAVLVMFYHYFGSLSIWISPQEITPAEAALVPYAWFGWIGVQVFFVISGFVIAYSASNVTPTGFLKSRFLRLFPTLWICACATFLVRWLVSHEPLRRLARQSAASIVLSPYTHQWLDPSYWTLPVEITFYFLILLLLLRKSFHHLTVVGSCLGMMSAALNVYQYDSIVAPTRHVIFLDIAIAKFQQLLPNFMSLLQYGIYFAIGTELWLFFFQRKTVMRAVWLLLFAGCSIPQILKQGRDYISFLTVPGKTGNLSLASPIILWFFLLSAIVFAIIFNEPFKRILGQTGARVTRALGLATYPLYLLHQAIGRAVISRLHVFHHDLLAEVALMSFILFFCVAILPRIESPLQHRLRLLLGVSKRQSETPAAALP